MYPGTSSISLTHHHAHCGREVTRKKPIFSVAGDAVNFTKAALTVKRLATRLTF